ITGLRGELAHHGGITAVHGGGNALLKVDGNFELTALTPDPVTGTMAQIVRQDGLSWQRYGFQIGQQGTLPERHSYTVTALETGLDGFGDRRLLGGGVTPAPPKFGPGTVSFTKDTMNGDTISATNLATLGFTVGEAITVTGAGVNNGVYHVAALVGTDMLRLAEKGALTTAASVANVTVLGDESGLVAGSDNMSVTSTGAPAPTASGNVSTGTFGLSYDAVNGVNKVLLTNGQSWLSLGFAVGQQVFIPGYGVRTIVGYDNGVDGSGNPLDGGVLLVDTPA